MQQSQRAPRIRVSYTLRTEDDTRHRFGVNSLAVDKVNGLLYSAGRDGIARCWQQSDNSHKLSLDSHSDWINDIALCPNDFILTASSDTTVKLWSASGQLLSTLNRHTDYVKALAIAHSAQLAFSGGLDQRIFAWDLATSKPSEIINKVFLMEGHKNSIYSLAVNSTATCLVSGSTENFLRIWDPRTNSKVCKLKGHTDNVKAVLINEDGTQCISASSDKTIKFWDIRQQKTLSTIQCHSDAVWCLATDPSFSTLYSGGRNGDIFSTDLTTFESELIVHEEHPVLKIALEKDDGTSMWVATTDSSIKKWTTSPQLDTYEVTTTIEGSPAIIKSHVLNNKYEVLALDSAGNVTLWDVLRGCLKKDLGKVDFDEQIKDHFIKISIASWFSIDTKLGLITVNLDQNQCFNAEIFANDCGFAMEDIKLNMGNVALHCILANWYESWRKHNDKQIDSNEAVEDSEEKASNTESNETESQGNKEQSPAPTETDPPKNPIYSAINIPPQVMVSFNDMTSGVSGGGIPICRLTCGAMKNVWCVHAVATCIPQWVADCVIRDSFTTNMNIIKLNFSLNPHPQQIGDPLGSLPDANQNKLSAIRILKVKKICKHVVDRLGLPLTGDTKPEDLVEIWCLDKQLDVELSIATVKQFIWNNSDDLQLYYRRHPNSLGKEKK